MNEPEPPADNTGWKMTTIRDGGNAPLVVIGAVLFIIWVITLVALT